MIKVRGKYNEGPEAHGGPPSSALRVKQERMLWVKAIGRLEHGSHSRTRLLPIGKASMRNQRQRAACYGGPLCPACSEAGRQLGRALLGQ